MKLCLVGNHILKFVTQWEIRRPICTLLSAGACTEPRVHVHLEVYATHLHTCTVVVRTSLSGIDGIMYLVATPCSCTAVV